MYRSIRITTRLIVKTEINGVQNRSDTVVTTQSTVTCAVYKTYNGRS